MTDEEKGQATLAKILKHPTAPMSEEEAKALAREEIEKALVLIERAQNDLYEACGKLSAIVGFVPEWGAVGKMGDRVKALWYRVRNSVMTKKRFTLDGMHRDAYQKRGRL